VPNGTADVFERNIRLALELADEAARSGDVPVGAIVTLGDAIVGRGANRTVRDQDATAHAELLALQAASATLGTWRLSGCSLYVTLEPCAMCAGAIVLARVDRVVFAAWDEKAGMAGSVADLLRHPRLNHRPEVRGGVLADDAGRRLQQFFALTRSADVR
jgi:tRNA(adenine34) deaminase